MNAPRRSLRVCYPFVGDTVGGSHLSVIPLVRPLSNYGVESLIVLHRDGPLSEYLDGHGIEYHHAPVVSVVESGSIPSQLVAMAAGAPRLATFLRDLSIDIVHTNDARMHLTWGLAARLAGCRFVWHQRSAEDSRRIAVYSRLAHQVLTISQYCRSRLAPSARARARVIYDPCEVGGGEVDRVGARARLLRDFAASEETKIVGFVGNLTEQKRPSTFVEAAAILRGKVGGDFLFPMVGELREPVRTEVSCLIERLGLSGQCYLVGPKYPVDLWISAFDVLVVPAVNEGLGRTLVEAMLLGTPVVAANEGGHVEVTDDGRIGMLVPPDDADAFADAVAGVLRDPERAERLAGTARADVRSRFALDRHLSEVVDVYRSLAE